MLPFVEQWRDLMAVRCVPDGVYPRYLRRACISQFIFAGLVRQGGRLRAFWSRHCCLESPTASFNRALLRRAWVFLDGSPCAGSVLPCILLHHQQYTLGIFIPDC